MMKYLIILFFFGTLQAQKTENFFNSCIIHTESFKPCFEENLENFLNAHMSDETSLPFYNFRKYEVDLIIFNDGTLTIDYGSIEVVPSDSYKKRKQDRYSEELLYKIDELLFFEYDHIRYKAVIMSSLDQLSSNYSGYDDKFELWKGKVFFEFSTDSNRVKVLSSSSFVDETKGASDFNSPFQPEKRSDIENNEIVSNNKESEPLYYESVLIKDRYFLDEPISVSFEMNKDFTSFEPPLFKDFEVLYGPSRSISSTDLEDQRDYIKSYSYILKARSIGTRVIESASFTYDNEVYNTQPKVVIVTDRSSQEQDPDISLLKKSDPEDKIEVEEVDKDISIPFTDIEVVPVFPGCEVASDKKACFQEQMQKHIRKHFRYPEIALEMGIQGRVNIMLVIQEDGSIGGIRMRGPDKNLEAEALRIINLLPNMTPGRLRGRPVKVPFSTHITFRIE
jgi:hypothetical protein